MIEISKLKNMLKCEAAASKWWDGLAPKEKKAYIAAHPKSKFAKGGKAPTTAKLDRLAEHHVSKANSYDDRAIHEGRMDGDPKKKAHYSKAGNLHATIARHYSNAAAAMSNNRPGAADIHLNRAEKTQHQLDQHLATKPGKAAASNVRSWTPAANREAREAKKTAKQSMAPGLSAHTRSESSAKMAEKHARLNKRHARLAGAAESGDGLHDAMALHHANAANHFSRASKHYADGDSVLGDKSFALGMRHAATAKATWKENSGN
jgi:hypothetical protein